MNNINKLYVNDTKESSIVFNMMVVLIGFAFFNLRGYGYYILLAAYAVFFLWMTMANVKLKINEELGVLCAAFFLYALIYGLYYKFSVYSFFTNSLILPVLSYVVGYHIILDAKKPYINEKTICLLIGLIVLALFLHGSVSIFSTPEKDLEKRLINDIVIGKKGLTATNTAGYLNLMAAMLFYGSFMQKNLAKKIVIIMLSVTAAYCGLLSATRTPVIMFVLVFFVCLICKILIDKAERKTNVKILFITLAVIAITAALYNANAFKMKDNYEQTSMYKRLNETDIDTKSSDNTRRARYGEVFISIFENPMGMYSEKHEYAHNLWLDMGRLTGVAPFFLMVIFSVMSLMNFLRFFFHIKAKPPTKYLMLSAYTVVFLNMFTEPIMEGLPFLCWIYTLLSGMLKSCLDNFDSEEENTDLALLRKSD